MKWSIFLEMVQISKRPEFIFIHLIGESMIPYIGRHGAKQLISGKPIRFASKMWALTTPLGYLSQIEPYQGERGRQVEAPCLGMGGSVVVDLISELQQEEGRSFHLTFDNLFTSLKLVDCLSKKKKTTTTNKHKTKQNKKKKTPVACTGTIHANRIEDCPLKSVKEMEMSKRGNFDYAKDVKSVLTVVQWHDNNIIMQHSFKQGWAALPHNIIAKRWSRAKAKRDGVILLSVCC